MVVMSICACMSVDAHYVYIYIVRSYPFWLELNLVGQMSMFDLLADRLVEDEFSDLLSLRLEVHQAEVHEAIVVHQAKVPKRKRYTHWVDGRRVKTSQPGATPMTREESCKEARHGKTEQELKKAQRPMV